MLIAIDPGTRESGVVGLHTGSDGLPKVDFSEVLHNHEVLAWLQVLDESHSNSEVVIEMISSYGMPVGRDTFETIYWVGRFYEANWAMTHRIYRAAVKLHLCNSVRAKDANIWESVCDLYGGKSEAVGNKKTPGPLYGVKSHCRQALALGIAYLQGCKTVEQELMAVK